MVHESALASAPGDLEYGARDQAPRVRFKIQTYPGESLQSILVRSAQEHVLWQVAPILTAARLKGFRPGRLQHLGTQDLKRLAHVLKQEPDALISRSILVPYARPSPGLLRLPKGVVDLQSRWIAPGGLLQLPYHRFAWNVRLLPYCPESGERLVNCCSACGHKLGWFQARGLGKCEHCLEDIAPSNECGLPAGKLDGYRRVARLLSVDAATRHGAVLECTSELQEFDSGKIAVVAIGLARILLGKGADKRELRTFFSLPAHEMADIVATAGDMLADWHNAPQQLLRDGASELGNNHADFRALWRALKVMADAKTTDLATSELVTLALPNLGGNVWAALKAKRRTYQSQEVLRVLGVRNEVVRGLADAHALPVEEAPSLRRRNVLFDADAVDDLRRKIDETISLNTVASRWNVPCYAIEQMAALGLLVHDACPALQVISGHARIQTVSVQNLIIGLERVAHPSVSFAGLVELRNAMKVFGGREKPWASIVQALLEGALPCWRKDEKFDVGSLLVVQSDVHAMQHLRFDRRQFAFPFSPMISQRDSEDLLNITSRMFMDHNLGEVLGFSKAGKGLFAPFDTVLDFARSVVPRSELAARWKITMRAVELDPRVALADRAAFGWARRQLVAAGSLGP